MQAAITFFFLTLVGALVSVYFNSQVYATLTLASAVLALLFKGEPMDRR